MGLLGMSLFFSALKAFEEDMGCLSMHARKTLENMGLSKSVRVCVCSDNIGQHGIVTGEHETLKQSCTESVGTHDASVHACSDNIGKMDFFLSNLWKSRKVSNKRNSGKGCANDGG